jgi:hypothetical protein
MYAWSVTVSVFQLIKLVFKSYGSQILSDHNWNNINYISIENIAYIIDISYCIIFKDQKYPVKI